MHAPDSHLAAAPHLSHQSVATNVTRGTGHFCATLDETRGHTAQRLLTAQAGAYTPYRVYARPVLRLPYVWRANLKRPELLMMRGVQSFRRIVLLTGLLCLVSALCWSQQKRPRDGQGNRENVRCTG